MTSKAVALNATLKTSGGPSSSIDCFFLIAKATARDYAATTMIRLVDHNIPPAVPTDEWPEIRRKILEAHILAFGTPI